MRVSQTMEDQARCRTVGWPGLELCLRAGNMRYMRYMPSFAIFWRTFPSCSFPVQDSGAVKLADLCITMSWCDFDFRVLGAAGTVTWILHMHSQPAGSGCPKPSRRPGSAGRG